MVHYFNTSFNAAVGTSGCRCGEREDMIKEGDGNGVFRKCHSQYASVSS